MNRRTFILAGSAGLTSVMFYGCGNSDRNANLNLVWDLESINAIGKKYREGHPDENDATKLANLLDEAGSDIESKLKEDFIAGRVVQVDGWIISVTEARQCALVSITQSA